MRKAGVKPSGFLCVDISSPFSFTALLNSVGCRLLVRLHAMLCRRAAPAIQILVQEHVSK